MSESNGPTQDEANDKLDGGELNRPQRPHRYLERLEEEEET